MPRHQKTQTRNNIAAAGINVGKAITHHSQSTFSVSLTKINNPCNINHKEIINLDITISLDYKYN